MFRLIALLMFLPWWAYIPASLGVVWLGETAYRQALESEAEKAAALEGGMPAPVDLGGFERARDVHLGDEVHVTGWIDPELNYELVKRKNGIPVSTRYMFMIFGAGDAPGAGTVRAALMLSEAERDAFLDHIDDYVVGLTDAGDYLFGFNGFASTSATLSTMGTDAIAEQGREKSAEFVYIAPFFEGREAALAPHGVADRSRLIFWAIAAAVALFGVAKRVMGLRVQPAPEMPVNQMTAGLWPLSRVWASVSTSSSCQPTLWERRRAKCISPAPTVVLVRRSMMMNPPMSRFES